MKNKMMRIFPKLGLHSVAMIAIAYMVVTMNVTCGGPGYQDAPPKEALRFKKYR